MLSVLNLFAPGAALLWRRRFLTGTWYLISFASLVHAAPQIGTIWAIYVWIMAQVHFHLVKRSRFAKLDAGTKVVMGGTAALMIMLYLVLNVVPSPTVNVEKLLSSFVMVSVSMIGPVLLLTSESRRRHVHDLKRDPKHGWSRTADGHELASAD